MYIRDIFKFFTYKSKAHEYIYIYVCISWEIHNHTPTCCNIVHNISLTTNIHR